MTVCGYPGCDVDTAARPYARKRIPSVTTVIDGANLGDKARKFSWAAGERSAVAAVHYTQDWWDKANTLAGDKPCHQDHNICAVCDEKKMTAHKEGARGRWLGPDGHQFEPGLCDACTYLRTRFHYDTKRKADLGGHLHHLALSWAQGDDIVTDEVTDPYLDGLETWYGHYQPKWLGLERTVYYDVGQREYVGSFDALGELNCGCDLNSAPRCLYLLDIKTGQGQWDLEWSLQLSGYRYAQSLTEWRDGTQFVTAKMPLVAHTAVLWLHDTGQAELVPVPTDAETFNQFLRLVDLYRWEKQAEKRLREKEKNGATV
jgi:hypothetical protein